MKNFEYTENMLIEKPAIALFEKLGWQTINYFYQSFGYAGTLANKEKIATIHRGEERTSQKFVGRFEQRVPVQFVRTVRQW